MVYEAQLNFLQEILKSMHISSCVLGNPDSRIPPEIDLGLRADLFDLDNYATFLQNSMAQAQDNTIYRFFDEYDCNYIFMRLPNTKDRYFFIGPYLLSLPLQESINQKAASIGLSPEQAGRMHLYYASLPIIEDENLLLSMANTLARHMWGAPEKYVMEYVDYAIPDRYEPIPYPVSDHHMTESSFSLSALEAHYANENLLMEAVSKGNLHQVTTVASSVFTNGTQQRLTDSLRNRKNYLVILKTLLRKAAENGGVHPLHVHRLTSHFASRIENIRSIKESLTVQEEMIRSYCQLVKRHSLSKYSFYVGQAITLVQYDLTADLSLKAISEKLNVNSSYLSNLFRREYGCTLTEFVNKQRIDHGIGLLQLTSKPVQEIAAECGIHDVNYFIKLFKKQTGFTPNRYREQITNQTR